MTRKMSDGIRGACEIEFGAIEIVEVSQLELA